MSTNESVTGDDAPIPVPPIARRNPVVSIAVAGTELALVVAYALQLLGGETANLVAGLLGLGAIFLGVFFVVVVAWFRVAASLAT